MSHSDSSEPPAVKHPHAPINRVEHLFETIVFASRWIQAPLYGGLIVAELLYAYKFLVELWEMIWHIHQQQETVFMLGVLGLIDVTMVANLLTMVIIGGYATFVSKLDLEEERRGEGKERGSAKGKEETGRGKEDRLREGDKERG